MRPKICVPIIAPMRDAILSEARKAGELPIQMVEWRVDFFAGYERELASIVEELKKVLGEKELIVTLRTEHEGGEPNGSRFDYFSLVETLIQQGVADYVDVEIDRDIRLTGKILSEKKDSFTRVIGSYHDFTSTPSYDSIVEKLEKAKNLGCDMGKLACMPEQPEDADLLLTATAGMKEKHPEFPLITMSMGKLGEKTRLYGGLYGSEVSFGCVGQTSAPGQIPYLKMKEVFDKIYSGKKHIVLIGFMGVGKSTVSEELKRQSGWEEVDTDQWIVRQEGKSIAEIFSEEGEEYFRQKETDMIDELAGRKPCIISCGGGMALRELNVRKLREIGEVVLLTAEPETIYKRVRYSTDRPLLNNNMNVEYIRELMEKRRPFYERAATVTVSTDCRLAGDIAKEILEKCSQI